MENDKLISLLAEYLSIAPFLTEYSPDSQYQRANQLALELAVWLPVDLYRRLGQAIAHPSGNNNPLTIISLARQCFADSAIEQGIIITHAPGIGKKE